MGVYLIDNPPARSQFRTPRRERPSGVCVIHTAENTPDFVAFDGGAEAVANFIRHRSDAGSYHDLVDSDSAIQLVRWSDEAFQDATGSNPHAWGGSVATRADVWPLAPVQWRNGAIRQLAHAAARYGLWLRDNYGIVVPARRITRAQSDARVPGFISHAERDPARRSDPGAGFPWDQFLTEYAAAYSGQPLEDPVTPEEINAIADAVIGKLDKTATAFGLLTHGQTVQEGIKLSRAAIVALAGIDKDLDNLDEAIVAGVVAPIADEIREDLAEQGVEVDPEVIEAAAERGVRRAFADAGTPDA